MMLVMARMRRLGQGWNGRNGREYTISVRWMKVQHLGVPTQFGFTLAGNAFSVPPRIATSKRVKYSFNNHLCIPTYLKHKRVLLVTIVLES